MTSKSLFITEVCEQIKYATTSYIEKYRGFDSFQVFKNYLIDEINIVVVKYEMVLIRDKIVHFNGKEGKIDVVIYQDEVSILSIEICWSFIGHSIAKLLANETVNRILISTFQDKSLPQNMLKRLAPNSNIQLIHIPNINFNHKPRIINENKSVQSVIFDSVDSPLEQMLEKRLKEKNINFISQYTVYERSYTGVMKSIPKYIVDFVVKGDYCKIAIECDGLYYHLRDFNRAYDTQRDLWLIKYGFDNVLRFYGDEMRKNLDGCIRRIIEEVEGWDNYHKKKKLKSIVRTNKINDTPNIEDVKLIVKDLAIPIASTVKNITKRELNKDPKIIIHKINKLIYKSGYSNEIPLLYYSFPNLSNFVNQTHGAYIGFNIPFVIFILKPGINANIQDYIKQEKRLLKIFILLGKLPKKITDVKQFVVINGCSGKVIESDILNVDSFSGRREEEKHVAKQKYYVVWSGKQTGIFRTWDECKKQVIGVQGARYKSFPTEHEANEAFHKGYVRSEKPSKIVTKEEEQLSLLNTEYQSEYIMESISVDAACSGNPGDMEYKGVYTKNGKEIFHFGPIPNGTNNIGEFIAIVHALALMKEKDRNLPVYSDSLTAISWVRRKKANTNIPRDKTTEKVWNLIERAEKWLHQNTYSNEVFKWETKKWGEIKADFGRK